jgi:hypothetical protein
LKAKETGYFPLVKPTAQRFSLTNLLNPATLVPKPPRVGALVMSPLEGTTMHRRTTGLILTLTLGLAIFAAGAQPLGKVPRIGLLAIGFTPSTPDWRQQDPFLQALRELGYREDHNLTLEYGVNLLLP